MNRDASVQKAVIFMSLAGWTVLFAGMVIANMLPPPDPSQSADQVAEFYRDNQGRIQIGSVLMFMGAGFSLFYVAAVSEQIRRMPGGRAALLARVQMAGGIVGAFMLLWAPGIWVAASLRPDERSPETLQMLTDLAWVTSTAGSTWFVVQLLSVAIAIFTDSSETPVYPRWLGYLSIWGALTMFPGPLDIGFTSGVFAWNGLITFWLGIAGFGAWFGAIVLLTLKSVDAQGRAQAPELVLADR